MEHTTDQDSLDSRQTFTRSNGEQLQLRFSNNDYNKNIYFQILFYIYNPVSYHFPIYALPVSLQRRSFYWRIGLASRSIGLRISFRLSTLVSTAFVDTLSRHSSFSWLAFASSHSSSLNLCTFHKIKFASNQSWNQFHVFRSSLAERDTVLSFHFVDSFVRNVSLFSF